MSLNITYARKMLRQIVGGAANENFANLAIIRYLGLSATKPTSEAISGDNYNVTEPSAITNYARVLLQNTTSTYDTVKNLYFENAGVIEYTYTIADVDATNYAFYVANGLFTRSGSGTPEDPYIYTRITTEEYDSSTTYYEVTDYEVVISNNNEVHFNEALTDWGTMRYFALFETASSKMPVYFGELIYDEYTDETLKVNASNFNEYVANGLYIEDGGVYTKLELGAEYDDTETYYIHHDGVEIKGGTVPLVRKNQLRISVK